jgi:cytosine/adenosine deaminase-related metal-dependent hydrolase
MWPEEFDVKPKLRVVGGTDVKMSTPTSMVSPGVTWDRISRLARITAAKRGF